jgi:hypothetical protein
LQFNLIGMCRVLDFHRSGFYAWLLEPFSPRAVESQALTAQIKEFYDQSMGIYGSPRIFCDLREAGVQCSENRVARRSCGWLKSSLSAATNGHAKRWAGPHRSHPTSCSVSSSKTRRIKFG